MKRRILLGMAGAAILVLGGARTASAQAQPDTAGLVRAVTSVLADSVMPRLMRSEPLFVATPAAAFDSATAAILRGVPGARTFGPDRLPQYGWIGTRGFTMQGDTAAVMVEMGSKAPSDGRAIDTYIEQNLFLFVPDASGWRYVRRRFVRGMDLGPVRG
jgi:hypothetical protein